jgi:nucleotide-binding universal stress UspA family protein
MSTNKVLIPVDGSDFSLQVVPQIMHFLKPGTAEFVLLHVEPEQHTVQAEEPGFEPITVYADQAETSLRAEFDHNMAPQIRMLAEAGYPASTAVRFGEPTWEIEQFIANEKVDMVAMTTHGRTGLRRAIYGSVAEHVLHHSPAPVFLYRSFDHQG